jgi:hypothetical protein
MFYKNRCMRCPGHKTERANRSQIAAMDARHAGRMLRSVKVIDQIDAINQKHKHR